MKQYSYLILTLLLTISLVTCSKKHEISYVDDTPVPEYPMPKLMDTVTGEYIVRRNNWSSCWACPPPFQYRDSLLPETLILTLSKIDDSIAYVTVYDSITMTIRYDSTVVSPFFLPYSENFVYNPYISFGGGLYGPGTHNNATLHLFKNDSLTLTYSSGGGGGSYGRTYKGVKKN